MESQTIQILILTEFHNIVALCQIELMAYVII